MITDHPKRNHFKAYEVYVFDGHEQHTITVRDSWFEDKTLGNEVQIMTTLGDIIVGKFTHFRPIRSDL